MRLTAESRLAVIDMQGRLLKAIRQGAAVTAQCRRLALAARELAIPVAVTEQNPAGIGPTVEPLAALAGQHFGKVHFSAAEDADFRSWAASGGTVVLCGVEAHVCVLQTALGLAERGIPCVLVADAVASRDARNRDAAVARARHHGIDVLTVEMVLFEWLGRYDRPEFKRILPLIKDGKAPTDQ